MKKILSVVRLVLPFTLLLCSVKGFAADTNDQLKSLKDKISSQHALIKQQQNSQARLGKALRQVEINIASAAKALYQTSIQQASVKDKQQQLVQQQDQLSKQKKAQQGALSAQLKSAYMTGPNNVLQLILNQEKSGETERLLGYYHYLNKARVESINTLKNTVKQLALVQQELASSALQLTTLKQKQLTNEKLLSKDKSSRTSALQALHKSYLKNSAQLEQFQLSEVDLKQLLKRVTVPKALPLKGLTKYKHKLPWPSKGKTRHRFGSIRHGQLRWKGITITGREGQAVTAIHHGRVIYSDWIKGFGLVLILDHGKGYMSLYGHNQALLKNAGDHVNANEKIALLGQSGGQNEPGLYFEIRHKGKAINPNRWLKK